jgi:hypothetical protein
MEKKIAKKYPDAPRFKVIFGYEAEFKAGFSQIMEIALRDVKNTVLKISKSK